MDGIEEDISGMIHNYDARLIHVGQWVRTHSGAYGDAVDVSTITTIACYGYTEDNIRVSRAPVESRTLLWSALVPLIRTDIKAGDLLNAIVDRNGIVILEKSRVVETQIFRHRLEDVRCINLILERN